MPTEMSVRELYELTAEGTELEKDQVEFIKRVELDYERGRKVFEIEFFHNGFEYEYDIDAVTGKILKYDKDRDD